MYTDEQKTSHISGLQQDLRVIHNKYNDILPKISGVYDSSTEDAVKRFQQRFGLPITGQTDLNTWDRIVHESNLIRSQKAIPLAVRVFPNAAYTATLGDQGRFIYILQAILNGISSRFSYLPSVEYTGTYDNATQDFVKSLQKNAGLPITGNLNADTWNAIAFLYSHVGHSIDN